MATIASLAVNLIAQTNRFTQPLKAAEKTVKGFNGAIDRTEDRLRRVESATNKASVRLLAMKGALAIATKQASDYAGAITAVHKQTGLAVESVQALRFAAERSDTDIATLETGLRSLVRRAAEAAEGNQAFAKGFERLGVNVRRADGRLKDTETLLMEVADGAANFATEAEASAALMLVMGDAGRRLVPFMRQGSGSVRELMDEAVALGIVMDKNAIAALANLGDEIGTTSNRIGAMSRDMAYRFSPAVSVVLGWVNLLIDGFFNLSTEQRQNIVRWTAYIGMILGAVAAVGVLSRVLIAGMGILRVFGTVAGVAFSPVTLKLLAVGALVALAITHFDDLKNWWENSEFGEAVRGAWAELEETWLSDELTLPEKVLASVRIVASAVVGLLESIESWWLGVSIVLARKTVSLLGLDPDENALVKLLEGLKSLWDDEELSLPEKALAAVRLTTGTVLGLIESISDWFLNATINLVRTVAVALGVDWENSKLGQLIDQVQEWWNREDVSLAEKALGVVAVAATITWALSFLRSFSTAVATQAGLVAGTRAARWSFRLGRVSVIGTLVWLLLPDETKEDVKDLWVQLAERIEEFNASTIESPFIAGVAQWLKDLPTDGWELPALTIGATFAGFTLVQSAATLAGMLGSELAKLLVGIAIPVAIAGGILITLGLAGMNIENRQALIDRIQEIWADEELTLVIKVAKILLELGSSVMESLVQQAEEKVFAPVRNVLGMDGDAMTIEVLRDPETAAQEFSEQMAGRETELRSSLSPLERVLGWLRKITPGFQSGTPWTGDGPLNEIAGVVHRREAVIPWSALKKGPAGVLEFLGVPGFQEGRGEGVLRSSLEALRPTLEEIRPGLADTLINGLDALANGVEFAREKFDELMRAIEDGPQAVDDAINSVREFQEETERAARQQDALNQLYATLLARLPVVNAMLRGMEAGAAFGPTGMVVGALVGVAMESETVAQGFRMVNDVLGAAANAVGMLLEPILPLIYVLQAVLVPVFNVLGTVLKAVLLPIMPFVFEALKWLGVVVLFVAEVFQRVRGFILDAVGGLVWGIGKAIDSLLGWITGAGRTLMTAGNAMRSSAQEARDLADEMNAARRDLIALTYEEAMARAKSTETLEKATSAMINIPTGFKYALARFDAATARPAPANVSPRPGVVVYPNSTPGGVGLSGGGPGMQVTIQGDVYGWDDFKRKVEQANAESKRSGGLASYGFGGATT